VSDTATLNETATGHTSLDRTTINTANIHENTAYMSQCRQHWFTASREWLTHYLCTVTAMEYTIQCTQIWKWWRWWIHDTDWWRWWPRYNELQQRHTTIFIHT